MLRHHDAQQECPLFTQAIRNDSLQARNEGHEPEPTSMMCLPCIIAAPSPSWAGKQTFATSCTHVCRFEHAQLRDLCARYKALWVKPMPCYVSGQAALSQLVNITAATMLQTMPCCTFATEAAQEGNTLAGWQFREAMPAVHLTATTAGSDILCSSLEESIDTSWKKGRQCWC